LVEHHFTGWNQVSATLTLLTWLAARTTTLRLGMQRLANQRVIVDQKKLHAMRRAVICRCRE
jgi:hypothetical protein